MQKWKGTHNLNRALKGGLLIHIQKFNLQLRRVLNEIFYNKGEDNYGNVRKRSKNEQTG